MMTAPDTHGPGTAGPDAEPIKAVAATGMLGTGFKSDSLDAAAHGADFIGCDAGSTDPGPAYLGSGHPQVPDAVVARDLELMLDQALSRNIPLLIGSAGTAGGRPHLHRTKAIIERLAAKRGWTFCLATIDSELDPDSVATAFQAGRLRPLANAPELTVDTIKSSRRIVAMQGVAPYQEALRSGAQVVLAGRSSDVSIYAAVPLMHGIPSAVAYHAGKILECGAASVEQRAHPDSMTAQLDSVGFTVEPPNLAMRCTPQSVASHSLYESPDPYRHTECDGVLDITASTYHAASERSVRVEGSTFHPSDDYTVRLEGARLVGYRTVAFAGVRDPLLLGQLDDFLQRATEVVRSKVVESLGVPPADYRLRWRIYGKNGTLGSLEPEAALSGHEAGLLLDVIADDQAAAAAIAHIAWHSTLHFPIPEYSGLQSNLAFPFSPPAIDVGEVFTFSLNHAMVLDEPAQAYRLQVEQVGGRGGQR